MKPGYLTTEFYVSILVVLCATVLAALSKIDSNVWAAVIGTAGTGYSLSRGLSKIGPVFPGPVVPPANAPAAPTD